MLDGWRMMAIVCPICNTCLMKKQTDVHCPGCDVPVRMQAAEAPTITNNSINEQPIRDERDRDDNSSDDDEYDLSKSIESLKASLKDSNVQSETIGNVAAPPQQRSLEVDFDA
jgi:uncharacterized Zn finger protein (UPF0148 family)